LMQRHADGEDEREYLEAVEGPAEIRRDERLPLRAVERAIPRHGAARGEFAHGVLPGVGAAARAGSSGRKNLCRDRGGLKAALRRRMAPNLPPAINQP